MREIKFRVWYCGTMVHNVGFHPHICMRNQDYKADEDCAYTLSPTFDSVNLMQFTGLKDKNGVEIYEGDIVIKTSWYHGTNSKKPITVTGQVKWNDETASFLFYRTCYLSLFADNIELEVIGNIYENHRL